MNLKVIDFGSFNSNGFFPLFKGVPCERENGKHLFCVHIKILLQDFWNMKCLKLNEAHPVIHSVILQVNFLDGRPAPVPLRDHVLAPGLVEGRQAEVLAGRLLHHVQGGVQAGAPLTYLEVSLVQTVVEPHLYHEADPRHPGHIVEQGAQVLVQHGTACGTLCNEQKYEREVESLPAGGCCDAGPIYSGAAASLALHHWLQPQAAGSRALHPPGLLAGLWSPAPGPVVWSQGPPTCDLVRPGTARRAAAAGETQTRSWQGRGQA